MSRMRPLSPPRVRLRHARTIARVAMALAAFACGDSPTQPRDRVATKLAFTAQPQDAVAGVAIAPAVRVALVDESGEPVQSATGEVTLALASTNGATLAGTTTAEAVNGVATFNNLIVTKTGSGYTLTATASTASSSLTPATSESFDIGPATASSAVFTVQPSRIIAGLAISPAIVVTLLDAFENVATTATGGVTLSVPSGGAPLFGTLTATPVNGVATFANVSVRKAGSDNVIVAQASGVQAVASTPFTVVPGDPAQLEWAQTPAAAEVMDLVGTPKVSVKDQYGNVVDWSNASVTLTLTSNPTSGILVGTTTGVSEQGVATFEDVRVDRPGNYMISASSGAMATPSIALRIRFSLDTIVAGRNHSCGISVTGFNYCWGANESGQLGDGTNVNRMHPVPVSDPFGAPAARFKQLSAGGAHSCGLTATGEAYCWGSNNHGQLGTGDIGGDQWSPLPVSGLITFALLATGGEHTCGVGPGLFSGAGYCWGRNTHGQIGDGTTTDRPAPTLLSGWAVKGISADSTHTCAVMVVNGQAGYCWGDNSYGQLGDATKTQHLSPQQVLGNLQFLFIEVGARHSCGISNDATGNSMRCWGSNVYGQMGSGATGGADVTSPTLVNGVSPFWFSAGGDHTCSRSQCWGRNTEGQLGDGSNTNRPTPVSMIGTPNPPYPDFVDVGGLHSCAVVIGTKEAYCWGSNAFGQLGDGTTTSRNTAGKVSP